MHRRAFRCPLHSFSGRAKTNFDAGLHWIQIIPMLGAPTQMRSRPLSDNGEQLRQRAMRPQEAQLSAASTAADRRTR
jgi:hypothetical protein